MAEDQVQSLVRELKSHKPRSNSQEKKGGAGIELSTMKNCKSSK